jgi:D-3-phosphoglycerate dehydrogenase
VGLDNVDKEYSASKGIEVHNTPEASSIAVAELAMALMLAVPNHLIRAHNSMAAHRWEKKELKRTELFGKTLGLIGCGRIATEVAKRAQAFGMKLIGHDVIAKSHDLIELRPSLDAVLADSDYISIHTPLTDETRHMVNKDSLGKMKRGAILVNTGRGKCVVEEDVVEALKSGQLGFYAADVWESDPPDFSKCPLFNAPNVLMAPHLGANSVENLERIGDIVVEKLTEFHAKHN